MDIFIWHNRKAHSPRLWTWDSVLGSLSIFWHGSGSGRWLLMLDREILGIYPSAQRACIAAATGYAFSHKHGMTTARLGAPLVLHHWRAA